MTVHFIYRSHYEGPTGLHRRRFDDATLLDWFRRHWEAIPDADRAWSRAAEILGCQVYTFDHLFQAIAEHSLPPPRSVRAASEILRQHLYINEIAVSPHLIQTYTDDDEIELAWYFFDDEYLRKHADRACYLLREDWKLPATIGPGGFKTRERTTQVSRIRGEGSTYLIFHDFWDSGNLDGLEGGYRIAGIRLPELVRYLACAEIPDVGCCFHYDMQALRSQLFPTGDKHQAHEDPFLFHLRENPRDESLWLIFNDWVADHSERSAGAFLLEGALRRVSHCPLASYPNWKFDPAKTLIQVEDHVAVMCRHVCPLRWEEESSPDGGMYHQWYLFDDLWASAHPDLANALLRYARRWDVL